MMFANRISLSTSCSIWLPETSPPSSARGVLRHRFQSCNTSNAHLKRVTPDANLVIVKGRPRSSRLLEKALPLGDQDDDVLPFLARRIGYSGSLTRAVGHWISHPDDFSRLRVLS